MDLTGKQKLFVAEYLIDLNATQAALRAGYSPKTAQFIGPENLHKPSIIAAIAEAQKGRTTRTRTDADWVLKRLVKEAEAKISDLFEEDGSVRPVKDWPDVWQQGLVTGVDVQEDHVKGKKVGQTVKLKLSDRIRRIELIGKHIDVGAFADRHEHGGIGGGPIETKEVEYTPQEAARRLLAILRDASENPDPQETDQ